MLPYLPNLKDIGPVVCEVCVSENLPYFFNFLFFFAPFYKNDFKPTNNIFLVN